VAGRGGSSLHYGDPWADPEEARDPVRRLRGRLPAGITIWTAGAATDGDWTGLTVSSMVLAQGSPARLAGLIGPESDLAETLEETGAFVVHVVDDRHRRLAQHFAGKLPAPEVDLAVTASACGPVLVAVEDRLYCRVEQRRRFGWSLLIEAVVEGVELGPPAPGLAWHRGRFQRL
jgi:flavin reductase (DIM6/NTAB) family NADH-FMN oxidoreductase RutF